ncbi:Adenine_phosphoribosyltransferase [Hexamita inflata]|uniref:adenine phosphoribosyltransferase n=1 Tax=Hexamita inflata TaxID=28002 RepID=A0ABP1KY96_9EUKA
MDPQSLIRNVPDFPIPGIIFKDFGPVFANGEAVKILVQKLKEKITVNPTKIILLEARGYLLGSILAHELGCGFVLVRKPGKLPGETFSTNFDLEYKKGEGFEMQKGLLTPDDVVIIHDDVLATGGTAKAAIDLVLMAGVKPENISLCFLSEMEELKGSDKLKGYDHFSLYQV